MGVDYLIVNMKYRQYVKLPKMGEWANELWKIWECFQQWDRIDFVPDTSDAYGRILDDPEWTDWDKTFLSERTSEELLYIAADLTSGANQAVWKAVMKKEIEARKNAQASIANV